MTTFRSTSLNMQFISSYFTIFWLFSSALDFLLLSLLLFHPLCPLAPFLSSFLIASHVLFLSSLALFSTCLFSVVRSVYFLLIVHVLLFFLLFLSILLCFSLFLFSWFVSHLCLSYSRSFSLFYRLIVLLLPFFSFLFINILLCFIFLFSCFTSHLSFSSHSLSLFSPSYCPPAPFFCLFFSFLISFLFFFFYFS